MGMTHVLITFLLNNIMLPWHKKKICMHSLLSAGVPQSPVTPVTRKGLWHVVTGVLWAGFTTGKFPSGTKRDPQYLSNPFGGM